MMTKYALYGVNFFIFFFWFLVLVFGLFPGAPSDVGGFYSLVMRLLTGEIPFGYPPVALPFFLLPQLFSQDPLQYFFFFMLQMALFSFLILFLLGRLFSNRELLFYLLLLFVLGPLAMASFDVLPAALVLSSLFLKSKGKTWPSLFILALATSLKLYPIFLLPIFLISDLKQKNYPKIFAQLGFFLALVSVFFLPYLLKDPEATLNVFQFTRSIEQQSVWGTLPHISYLLGFPLKLSFIFNTPHLDFPLLNSFSLFIFSLQALILFLIYFLVYLGKIKFSHDFALAFFILLTFLLTSKVFSPQYLFWLLPLLLFVKDLKVRLTFLLVSLLTFYTFTHFSPGLATLQTWPVLGLILRNLSFIALWVLTLKTLKNNAFLKA